MSSLHSLRPPGRSRSLPELAGHHQ